MGSCREALAEGCEWLGNLSGASGVARRPSQSTGSARVALPEGHEWSGGLSGEPGVVGWPF